MVVVEERARLLIVLAFVQALRVELTPTVAQRRGNGARFSGGMVARLAIAIASASVPVCLSPAAFASPMLFSVKAT